MGRSATHCTGYRKVATAARSGCVSLKRVSATMRNSARALNTISLDSADGPCLKKGGGVRSSVPSGIAVKRAWLLGREDGAEALHALQRDAATADHAGERILGHQHRQAGLFREQSV